MRSQYLAIFGIIAIGASMQLFAWSSAHQIVHPTDAPGLVSGLSFSPYTREQEPNDIIDRQALRDDLALLATKARAVRTYAATGGVENIPAEAARHGLSVTLGAWVDGDLERTRLERESVIDLANRFDNVERIMMGNEALFRDDVSIETLIAEMNEARARVGVPVGTAEPWHVWLANPELAENSDFLGVHILPYWEGIDADGALAFVDARLSDLRAAFPGKPIVLAEIGWPSDGARIGGAVASQVNQARLLRDFVNYAKTTQLEAYFLVEAFDQPWKKDLEGLAGAYWGVFDADRAAKFSWDEPIIERSTWPAWGLLGALIGILPLMLALRLRPGLKIRAALPLSLIGQLIGGMIAFSVLLASERYFDGGDWALWSVMMLGELLLFVVLTIEIVEAASMLSSNPSIQPAQAKLALAKGHWPKVSIHVPCCNEPPALLRQTLNALSRLDYPNFEVLVIDNNTSDLSDSDAIAAICNALGPRFRFLHLPKCAGYKAGALNRALQATAPDASLIAVVDSDYVVEPHWLKTAIPHFAQDDVGIVQAPQDYRDGEGSTFKKNIYWEYRAFFRLGMVFRAEDNAIIQHGTMTIIRRSALEDAGEWDEHCITEDAELGLRLFASGWQAVYLPMTLGRGLMPDDTESYGGQRFRWAFGAMQILRRHAGIIFGRADSKLSFAQRYHFVAGWLPWIGDAAGLIVVGGSIVWAMLAAIWPAHFEPPEAHFLVPVLCVFALRQIRLWWLYGKFVEASPKKRLGAMVAGGALAFSVARAVICGMMRKEARFQRTPKARPAPRFLRSVMAIRTELVLLFALCGAAMVLVTTQNTTRLDVQLWFAVIALQAWPYMASFIMAILASYQKPFAWRAEDEAIAIGTELKEAAE
jgi:exo-beta-1,3-glucanase (GH17 family)/cellulose synthase/poly-beta-1,6-N-acetylglucosamine synthase-like glycosyltransferase